MTDDGKLEINDAEVLEFHKFLQIVGKEGKSIGSSSSVGKIALVFLELCVRG